MKKPRWVRGLYGDCVWEMPSREKVIYLTFDDGPDPEQTPFVMEQLHRVNAKGTFFCLGRQVEQHQTIFASLRAAGHSIGNHTFSHLDGWKTGNSRYYRDIAEAAAIIDASLFRPPFGHITWNQVRYLKNAEKPMRTILWDVLSADFDEGTAPEKCLNNVLQHATAGSIVLFHDTATAARNMRYALPRVLDHFGEKGYRFEGLQL